MGIKMLHLYTFPGVKGTLDLSGIWETTAVRELDSKSPIWTMIRRYSCAAESPVGVEEKLPAFVIELYMHPVSREALFGTNKKKQEAP